MKIIKTIALTHTPTTNVIVIPVQMLRALDMEKDNQVLIELDGDKIKDTATLDALVEGDFAGLVVTTEVKGANTSNPPANTGGGKMSRADIMKIKDTAERQKAMIENASEFGLKLE